MEKETRKCGILKVDRNEEQQRKTALEGKHLDRVNLLRKQDHTTNGKLKKEIGQTIWKSFKI